MIEYIKQLEMCGYMCQAGPLENNTAFIALKEIAEAQAAEQGTETVE
jgi:hypothetical protein